MKNKLLSSIVFLLLCSLLHGCTKGVKEAIPYYVDMVFVDSTVSRVNSQVYINEEAVYPFLTDGSYLQKRVYYSSTDSATIHLRIEQLPDMNVLADLLYTPGVGNKSTHYLTLYQARMEDSVKLVLPGNEPLPPAGYTKFQFTYRDTNLPDSVKLRFYKTTGITAIDSCIVKRFRFSGWTNIRAEDGSQTQYEALDAKTGSVIKTKGTFITNQFFSIDDYMIYSFQKDVSGTIALTRLY
ncbi:MAG: hypothetical protein QM731_05500 [Chitinophagaceae bacterium]